MKRTKITSTFIKFWIQKILIKLLLLLLEKSSIDILKRPKNHTRKYGSFVCRPIWIKYDQFRFFLLRLLPPPFVGFVVVGFCLVVVYHKWNYTNAVLNLKNKCFASHMLHVQCTFTCVCARTYTLGLALAPIAV